MPRFILLASLLALAGPALAADRALSSVTADLDGDGKADRVVIYDTGTEADPSLLKLAVELGSGRTIVNPTIIRKVGPDDAANVGLALQADGSVRVTSERDWGTSLWSSAMVLSFRQGKLKVSGLDYTWLYREAEGYCELDFLGGTARINHKPVSYSAQDIDFSETTSIDPYVAYCLDHAGT